MTEDKIFIVTIKAPKQWLVSLIDPERDELKADVKGTSPSARPDPTGSGCGAL